MYIVLAILAFGVLIAVHELGHFLVAKACGVRVNEFALGMGPKLFQIQGKETLYTLRALPIGGYTAMEGEDEDTGDPRAFTQKKPWQRALILCAGAAMNFLLGFLLVLCIAPYASFTEPVISGFYQGCPYEGADALQTGDRIYSVDGHRTFFRNNFDDYMARAGGDVHDIAVIRDGKRVTLHDFAMPKLAYTRLDNGEKLMSYGLVFAPREFGFGADLRYSWYESLDLARTIWRSLGDLVSGAVQVREMSGVVGVVDYAHEVTAEAETREEALFDFTFLFALVAVNLAVMNMLPIPALDGGRVFFLIITALIEWITRRKVNPKYEGYIHTAGFVLMLGLVVLIMFNDVVKIITR